MRSWSVEIGNFGWNCIDEVCLVLVEVCYVVIYVIMIIDALMVWWCMRDMYVVIYAWEMIKVDLGVKPRDSEYDIDYV